jgi:hypothetical protein
VHHGAELLADPVRAALAAQYFGAQAHEHDRDEVERESQQHDEQRNEHGIDGRAIFMTEGAWCSEFHHSTEKRTMGTLITPMIASTALVRSAREVSSIAERSPM